MVKRATKSLREKNRRQERKIIVVACEGTNKTELTYLTEFNQRQKAYRIIPAKGNNTDPENLIEDASKSAEREALDYSFGDKSIAVFDTDIGKEQQIRRAIDKAKRLNIEVFLSNPCFEVWLLLHFRYSTKNYYSSSEVVADLKREWKEYTKNIDSFEIIYGKTKDAVEHAEKLEQYNRNSHSQFDITLFNPGTEIHRLVKTILGIR